MKLYLINIKSNSSVLTFDFSLRSKFPDFGHKVFDLCLENQGLEQKS